MKLTREKYKEQYVVSANGRMAFCRCETCDKGVYYDVVMAMKAVELDEPLHCPNCDGRAAVPQRREQK